MAKSWELLLVFVSIVSGTVAGAIASIFGFFFKNMVKDMQKSLDKLSESIQELVRDGTTRDVQNKELEGLIRQGSEAQKRVFASLSSHNERISTLELFKGKLVLVHNKEHPNNRLD